MFRLREYSPFQTILDVNKPRLDWRVAAFVAVLAAIITLCCLTPREPAFQGRTLDSWLGDINDPTKPAYQNALAAFRQMQPSPAPFLVKRLKTKGSFLYEVASRLHLHCKFKSAGQKRSEAARGLMALGPAASSVFPDVAKLIGDPELEGVATMVLTRIGPGKGPELLAAFTNMPRTNFTASLGDRRAQASWPRRRDLECAIGAMGTNAEPAVPVLLRDLKDSDSGVKIEAIRALTGVVDIDEKVRTALLECLKDNDYAVRDNTAQALAGLDMREWGSFYRQFSRPDFDPLENADKLPSADPRVVAALAHIAERDSNYGARDMATHCLLKIDPKGALERFTRNLESADLELRRNSAWNFIYFKKGGRSAVPLLVKCLSDKDDKVRQNAVVALREIGEDAEVVVPALRKLLDDPQAQMVAAVALGNYGTAAKAAVPRIIEILKTGPSQMEGDAIFTALCKIDPEAAARFQQGN